MKTECQNNVNNRKVSSIWDAAKRKEQSEMMKKLFAGGLVPGRKGKKATEKTKQQQREAMLNRKRELGYINSAETRQKLRIINSGENNPMFGVHKIGKDAPYYGKHHTKEARKKIGRAHEGITFSEETRKKISRKLKGIPKSPEHIKNMSISRKGSIPWNKEKICPQFSGNNNPNWLGGKSFEPYGLEFNKEIRNKIRKRDNQVCMNCGLHREQIKQALDVHHINYDKKLNLPENLISLCRRCHVSSNFNREYWQKLFQEKISKIYDYQYQNGLVIIKLEAGTI